MVLVFAISIVTLFISMSFLTGCGGASSPTSQPPATTQPVSTSQPAETINLKFYTEFPPNSGVVQEGTILADVLSEMSNGRIKLTVYPAAQLGPIDSVLDLLKNGITDFAAFGTPRLPTLFPLENAQEIALAEITDWTDALDIRNQLTLGEYGEAFARNNLHFLNWSIIRPQQLFMTTKVSKAEDLKGLKVRAPNPIQLDPFKQFGVVSVPMPMGDVYESLQRGVIDGCVNTPENAVANKWTEVAKFHIVQNLAYGGNAMVISKGSWDKLPPDIQAIIDQAIPQWQTQAAAYYKDIEIKAITTMKEAGVEVYHLDSAEADRWVQLQRVVVDEWTDKSDAPGVPAKMMIEKLRELSSQ
jgi:TRAP-type C4-dicarboxylate transport system substrate-binding protein